MNKIQTNKNNEVLNLIVDQISTLIQHHVYDDLNVSIIILPRINALIAFQFVYRC